MDFAVLGVHLSGFDVSPAPPGAPVAIATAADSCIVLVLPPQHVAEETVAGTVPPGFVARAELSGTSRVAFSVPVGAQVPLTAAGVLAACTDLRPGGITALDTWVELPWGLAFGPAGPGLDLEPRPTPVASPAKTTGLWLARVRAGGDRNAGLLQLVPLDGGLAGADGPPFPTSLTRDHRLQIASMALPSAPAASRLELSSLGGSLSASGSLPGFRWAHRTALARDQAVRVEERVRLYPFGFPAVLTTITERDPVSTTDDIAPVAPGDPVALRSVTTLRLDDTVRETPDGSPFSRTFPFDRIEVSSAVFRRLGQPAADFVAKRPLPSTQPLTDKQAGLREDQASQALVWGPFAQGGRTVEDLVRANNPAASTYVNAQAALAEDQRKQGEIDAADASYNALIDQADEYDRQADELRDPFGLKTRRGGDSAQVDELRRLAALAREEAQQYRVDPGYRNQVRADTQAHTNEVEGAWGQIAGLVGQPRDVHDVVNLGDEQPDASAAARTWLEDEAEIGALQRQIDGLQATQSAFTITQWPMAGDGTRLQFPVRLSRGAQCIDVTMPMVMVRDFVLPEDPALGIVAYASLEDPGLPLALERSWAGPLPSDLPSRVILLEPAPPPPSVVSAGGALWDVVGSAAPKPSDTHVMQSLNIVAASVSTGDMFTPSLGRLGIGGDERWSMQVSLPALQQLAGPVAAGAPGPEVATSAAVSYARQFIEAGDAADVLFTAAQGIGIDFTNAADRSGGLAALQLASDGISRLHGPVQLDGLMSGDPKKMIGDAATLLGFKLRDLISVLPASPIDPELPAPPDPPTIVSELVDGAAPVVRMEWTGVLQNVLAFRTFQGPPPARQTTLDLQVVSTPERVTTDCTISDFYLQFPFEDSAALIRLDFSSVNYHQVTEHRLDVTPEAGVGAQVSASPPKVGFEGFDVTFLGPLELLKSLQDAVDLLGNTPGITATPGGVRASMTLPVPDVGCGVFALSNVVFHSAVDVPFDAEPISVSIGFASRDKPFSLSVLSFGGGGYIDIRIDADGPQIEASLEFGAQLSVNFVVARGEVHALGGVSYTQTGSNVAISGYLRIGGSLEVLAIISVSVELRIALTFDSETDRLVGRATLVLEIDLTLWSDSVEIDSGEWVLQGGSAPTDAPGLMRAEGVSRAEDVRVGTVDEALAAVDAPVSADELATWKAYRAAFTGTTP